MAAKPKRSRSITIRIGPEVEALLMEAVKLGPYELSITSVVERGVRLAHSELLTIKREAARG